MVYLSLLSMICLLGFILRICHLIFFGYPYNAGIDAAYHTSMIIWLEEQGISHIYESRPNIFPPSPPFLYLVAQIFMGFNEFGAGILTVAALNVVEIVGVYLLSDYLFDNKTYGLLSAFIVATSPAELIYVLNGWWLSSVAISLIPLCYLFCIRAIRDAKKSDIISGSILLAFLSLSYPIYYFPFLGGLTFLCFLGKGDRRALTVLVVCSLLASLLYLPLFVNEILLTSWGFGAPLSLRFPSLLGGSEERPVIFMVATSIPIILLGALGLLSTYSSYRRNKENFNDLASMTYLFPLVGLAFLATNISHRQRFVHLIPVMMAIESPLLRFPNSTIFSSHINPLSKPFKVLCVLAILLSIPFSAILLSNSFERMMETGPKVLDDEKAELIVWIRKKTPKNSVIVLEEGILDTWALSMHRYLAGSRDYHSYLVKRVKTSLPNGSLYQLIFQTTNYQVYRNMNTV